MGCGNGSLSHALAQRGYDVVGLEESPSGVAIAQRHFPDCQFIQGSLYSPLELLDNSFDLVISIEVIEHLFYPKELPRLAKRCLKPHGRLIISTPYHGYLKNLALALSGSLDSHYGVHWDGGHIKFFSVPSLSQLLMAEGYSALEFKFAGRLPYLWKTMLCSARLTP
ncbi:MAG: class I SAM-dependent methyltransferase [Nodosilinea sp. LVE1205-7]